MSRPRKSARRIKAALVTLGVLALVCGSVAAGIAWEAVQKRTVACFCACKTPGYLN